MGNRNVVRRRVQQQAQQDNEEVANDSEEDDEADKGKLKMPDGKIGAKKRAKLEAKAEKRAQKEAMDLEREQKKKRELQEMEERKRQNDKELEEERLQLETEKKAQEEKERKEYEEYLKMKEAFSVEEEGYDELEEDQMRNLLQEFVEYIKTNKVVVLESLASHFRLKTAKAIDRIRELQANGTLTGVLDDRGKFIYISQAEFNAVAKFVKRRGRVSIAELAESSNILIDLNPKNSDVLVH